MISIASEIHHTETDLKEAEAAGDAVKIAELDAKLTIFTAEF